MEGELYNVQEGLEGELGFKGERGYSAYEIAVLHGYEGTEQDWIDHFGLDLSGYVQTSDVIDNLTSEYTTHPLSAKQGKELKTLVDGLDTSKADASDVYTKNEVYTKEQTYTQTEVDAMLENINGKVLWVNPNPNSSFSSQLIQLDLSYYDELEIWLHNYASVVDKIYYPVKLIKFYNGVSDITNELRTVNFEATILNYSSFDRVDFGGCIRKIEWKDNGVQFGDSTETYIYGTTDSQAGGYISSSPNYFAVPIAIIGRKRGIYDFRTNQGGE